MEQFDTIVLVRTFKNYFGHFVSIEKKKKTRVTITVAFHFMKRRLKDVFVEVFRVSMGSQGTSCSVFLLSLLSLSFRIENVGNSKKAITYMPSASSQIGLEFLTKFQNMFKFQKQTNCGVPEGAVTHTVKTEIPAVDSKNSKAQDSETQTRIDFLLPFF